MSDLIRMDDKPVADGRRECRAFLAVRDESLRLPYVLDYHRNLGVDRFFIADNVSSDGSLQYLLRQDDCHVYSAPGSYAAAKFGVQWINQMVEWHGREHWCLSIDADECLVYPDCETVSLPRFCEYLDRVQADGMFSIMLDMYSNKSIADTHYERGANFLSTCPYFDGDYYFRRRLRRFPSHEFIGGPRLRCFYPEFAEAGKVGWTLPKIVRSMRNTVGISSTTWGITPPMLIKIPLIRGGAGSWLSSHKTTPLRLAEVTGGLLHFKYFSDFHERVMTARAERQHFDAASEYARYEAALQKNPHLSFYYANSVFYMTSHDLVTRGFMTTCDEYQQFSQDRAVA